MRYLVASSAALFGMMPALLLLLPSVAAAQAVNQTDAPRRYTHHPANAGAAKTVVISLDASFAPDERAKILRAIEEWNHSLNGYIRFDIVAPGRGGLESWSIRAQKGGSPRAPDPAVGQPLSITQAGFLSIGGSMVIYTDHIGTRDLRGVVLHELGHVLGLVHDPRGNLMSARYSPTTNQCVDRPTAEMVAARHNLPIAGLNWCEALTPRTSP